MNVATLQTFVDVFRAGSFSLVARAHGVTPSSVSRAISALEEELGSRLFQRTTRRLSPTESGTRFFERVVPILEELERARHDVGAVSTLPRGRLRVSASVAYAQMVIVPRLREFTCAYPDIELELEMSDRRVDIVAERFDLAIRHGSLADSSLVTRRLERVDYHLVASPAYLEQAPAIQGPKDVSVHPCVTFSGDAFRQWTFRRDNEELQVDLGKRLSITGALGVRSCALMGIGIAVLPRWAIQSDLSGGLLVSLLPEWKAAGSSFDSSLWLLFPSRSYVPAKVRAFEELVFPR